MTMMRGMDSASTRDSDSSIPSMKVVLIGDQNVGKSCLIKRYIHGTFGENENATLGCQFY